MKIAIAVLNWNGKNLLKSCLPSILQYSGEFPVIVIDNNSTDNSVEFLQNEFPQVQLIELKSNLGYAGGYKEGLKHIDSDIVCLLNNDAEVSPLWLEPIIEAFKDSDIGIIQPKILDYYKRDHFEYAGASGGFIDKFGFPYCRGRIFDSIEKDEGQYDESIDILWASGACMFIRKSLFDQLGGFDERFFAHMEEIDLCWRAKASGYKIKCVPKSVVYHMGGATLSSINPQKTYLNFRNSLFMLSKNLPTSKLFPILLSRLVLDGIAALKFFFQADFPHSFAVLRAHLSFYWVLIPMLRQRDSTKKQLNYHHKTSIVWSYYVDKIKTFNRL